MEGDKNVKNVLDLGCGSGVLSFLCKKSFKKAKIVALDCNKAAVDTTNINAAQHHFDDITAYHLDVTKGDEFKQKLKE
jgi:methylase of polypeptide subunit release factors